MLATYSPARLQQAGLRDLSDDLEKGHIVFFPECPIALPGQDDLEFLRSEMPSRLKLKNVSYHPELDAVVGLKAGGAAASRVTGLLKGLSLRIQEFLAARAPALTANWQVGTCSFRPLQERGRNLEPHASNELIHVDAGAYGATHGDRILRFFVNVNPVEPREWASKGSFADLFRAHAEKAGFDTRNLKGMLRAGLLERLYSGGLRRLARAGLPAARLIDTSPYDRAMRRFHNYMKDTPEFQNSPEGLERFSFPPFSAWIVFTDGVSHASVSGQFAFVQTCIVPAENCRLRDLLPLNILNGAA